LLQIVGSKVENLKTNQLNQVKNLCILQTILSEEKNAEVTNALMATVTKQLEAKGGLPGTAGESNSVTKVYNKMKLDLDQSTVNDITKNCIMNIKQDNVIQIFGSNVKNADLGQINKGFVECLQGFEGQTGMTADLANQAETEVDESLKASGMDPTASLASLGQMYMSYIGGIVAVCIASLICSAVVSMGAGGGGGGAPPSDMGSGGDMSY
jgi:hypothetical protein